MKHVKHMQLQARMTVGKLVEEMNAAGVLGAGRIGKATNVVTEMFSNSDCTVFLTLAGALVPAGLRRVICDLIEQEHVHVLVTTGANMVHDMVEALGYQHGIGTFAAEDKRLKAENIGRIGDIYIQQEAFEALEKWLFKTLDTIPEEKRQRFATAELLYEIGKKIEDRNSILATAARKNVPIICPAFVDSIAGFQLWVYGQDKTMHLDPLLDVNALMDKVYEAKKVGIIILGGGFPKHFALFANTFREGVDLAVQITMDRPEPGGLSGASLEEAISWGKIKPDGKSANVICDVTIAFPIIIAAVLDRLRRR
ncbi:MAG: deoxyhypusine synthase [Candidatus Bathyarchaeota archaeon]|jgi:deoxyhypusine synthase|nr:deoxyhypusine synthase [Candidatus Bathyarchaeota archaeon]